MRRPAWCDTCGKAFQAKSRKQRECPACLGGPSFKSSRRARSRLPILIPLLIARSFL